MFVNNYLRGISLQQPLIHLTFDAYSVEHIDRIVHRHVGSNLFSTMAPNDKQNPKSDPNDPLLAHFEQNSAKIAESQEMYRVVRPYRKTT